jgi:hypothetical protein
MEKLHKYREIRRYRRKLSISNPKRIHLASGSDHDDELCDKRAQMLAHVN